MAHPSPIKPPHKSFCLFFRATTASSDGTWRVDKHEYQHHHQQQPWCRRGLQWRAPWGHIGELVRIQGWWRNWHSKETGKALNVLLAWTNTVAVYCRDISNFQSPSSYTCLCMGTSPTSTMSLTLQHNKSLPSGVLILVLPAVGFYPLLLVAVYCFSVTVMRRWKPVNVYYFQTITYLVSCLCLYVGK